MNNERRTQIIKNKQVMTAQVAYLNQGMMMGDDDAIAQSKYTKTVRCKTLHGELLRIEVQDFINLVRISEHTKNIIQNRIEIKEEQKKENLQNLYTMIFPKNAKKSSPVVSNSPVRSPDQHQLLTKEIMSQSPIPSDKLNKLMGLLERRREKVTAAAQQNDLSIDDSYTSASQWSPLRIKGKKNDSFAENIDQAIFERGLQSSYQPS